MIWYNGYIKFKEKQSSMFDDCGNPIVEDASSWSDFIPCGYEDSTLLTATSNEKSDFTSQSFTVRIKKQEIKERVRIFDESYKLLGEFVVKSCNHYKYIDETHFVCNR